ncbi:TIGR03747 family integrating conjugative element membrane protein [Orbus sturtevantii]|uniref:TIGR03747 family integrating conjugative element membrane protein n=1 Tax=Orbus sturtevantii TaxID=3074109 RepID=UPI00370DDC43
MANEKTQESKATQTKSKTGVSGLIGTLLATLFFSLLMSIIIECVGITFFWPEEGDKHSEMMLDTEFGYLSHDFVESFILSDPVRYTERLVKDTYELLAIKTGLIDMINGPVSDKNSSFAQLVSSFGVYIKAVINIILVFLVRLTILVLSTPIFLLAAMVGAVDGLVRRDIRRFGAGRESSFLYYHAKAWIKPLLIIAWLIYLSVPFSIHPNLVFIPMAVLFGMSLSITFGSFKKYI